MTDIPNNHTLIDFHRQAEFPLLRLTDKFVFVGSCFSDEMSKRLKKDCIDTIVNPFGTIYNPVSIHDCLRWCLSDKQFGTNDVMSYQNLCFTQYHATSFDRQNASDLLEFTNKSLEKSRRKMHDTEVFLITYGTEVVWEYNDQIMANCHKIPQTNFTRRMLSMQEITQATDNIVSMIRQFNPNAKIIFTISPVRHKNPDLLTNSYSKALLKVGLEQSLAECDDSAVSYFPSFEIVTDQLRDYSHYGDDGVHLTDNAADYIYERVLETFFSENDIAVLRRIRNIKKMIKHKTAEYNQAYYDNMEKIRKELDNILRDYPTKKLEKLCNKVKIWTYPLSVTDGEGQGVRL